MMILFYESRQDFVIPQADAQICYRKIWMVYGYIIYLYVKMSPYIASYVVVYIFLPLEAPSKLNVTIAVFPDRMNFLLF